MPVIDPWKENVSLRAKVAELRKTVNEYAGYIEDQRQELAALKESQQVAQAGQGEPVAWMYMVEKSSGSYADNYEEPELSFNKPDNHFLENVTPLYTQAPTCYSAGDMADQGAKAFREGRVAPEGWQLVPKEPTTLMMLGLHDMAINVCDLPPATNDYETLKAGYKAMLSAAPQPTEEKYD